MKEKCQIPKTKTNLITELFEVHHLHIGHPVCTMLCDCIARHIKSCLLFGLLNVSVCLIAVFLGVTLAIMEERGKPLLDFFTCLSEAMMTITTWVIYMAPIGVFFLIGGQILEMKDFSVVAGQLGLYFMTVLVGLFVHGFVVLPIIFSVCTRQLPFR